MYCRKCGNNLADDNAFCSKCGAKVIRDSPPVDETAAEETSTPTPNESTEETALGNFATWFFMYLFVFSLITLCIVAMFSSTSVVEWVTVPEVS